MSYHFTPTGALTDASQTASIAEIKTKTDKITITSNLNLSKNTMETDIATNLTGINGILNHTFNVFNVPLNRWKKNARGLCRGLIWIWTNNHV